MEFEIKKRIIKSNDKQLIIGDNADYVAHFTFDEEWEGVTKTARFISCKGEYKDVLLENDQCTIPCEVLKCGHARAGVYSAEMTTTECEFLVVKSIKDDTGCECEPTPSVYEQLTKLLDDLYKLMPNEVAQYFEKHKEEFKGDKGDKGEKGEDGAIKFIPVNELPTENIDDTAIYLIPSDDPKSQNKYKEYIYKNGEWEVFGETSVKFDAEGYVKFTDIATSTKAGVVLVKTSAGYGVGILESGVLRIVCANNAQISSKASNYMPIVPATLDFAVKKALADCKLEGDNAWTEEEKTNAQNLLGVPQIELTQKENGAYKLTINKG